MPVNHKGWWGNMKIIKVSQNWRGAYLKEFAGHLWTASAGQRDWRLTCPSALGTSLQIQTPAHPPSFERGASSRHPWGGKYTLLPSAFSNIPKIQGETEMKTEKYKQRSSEDWNTDQSWHRTDVSAVCGQNQTPTTHYTNHWRCKDKTMWARVCVFLCVSEAPTGSECAILAKQLLPFTQNTLLVRFSLISPRLLLSRTHTEKW